MTSLLTSFYLLSFKDAEVTCSTDVDCVNVSSRSANFHGAYSEEKCDFFKSRTNKIKKHWGWKRNIKSVDRLFRSYRCISISFDFNQLLKLFFSNGTFLTIEFSCDNSTVERIEICNNFTGKFIQSRIVDAVICRNNIYVTYCEPKLSVVQINQENSSRLSGIKEKLIGPEFKISHVDIIGPSSKSIERKLSLSSSHNHLLVWWKFNIDDVLPWTPISFAADRINMVIYTLNDGLELLCTVKAHGDLIEANFSKQYSNQILTLEKVKGEPGDVNICVYEIIGDQYNHIYLSKLPLQGIFLTCDWSTNEKLLISDSKNLLLIYDLRKKTSIVTNLLYPPKQIAWHPNNCIALVVGSDNQLQCFDAALNCVKFQLFYSPFKEHNLLNLNSYFPHCCSVQKMLWHKSERNNSCILLLDSDVSSILTVNFCSGSITQNKMGVVEFVSQYLKSNSVDEAILLMRSLSWNHESELCFQCLSKVTNFLLRKPLDFQILRSLELALGTFYDQMDTLSKRVIKNYQYKINHLARRFFHHLLRHFQFRKAFLLAIDLDSQDLFLDLYHMAKQCGESALATVALSKAEEFKTSSSSCSSSSASCISESDSTSNEEESNFLYSSNNNMPCTIYGTSSQSITPKSRCFGNLHLPTNDLLTNSKNVFPDKMYFPSEKGSTFSELDSSRNAISEAKFKQFHEKNSEIYFPSSSTSKLADDFNKDSKHVNNSKSLWNLSEKLCKPNDSDIVNFEKKYDSSKPIPSNADKLNFKREPISKLLAESQSNYSSSELHTLQNTFHFGSSEIIHKKSENDTFNSRPIKMSKLQKYSLRPSEQSDHFQNTFDKTLRKNSALMHEPPTTSTPSQYTYSEAHNVDDSNRDSFITGNREQPESFILDSKTLNKSTKFSKTSSEDYKLKKSFQDACLRNHPSFEPNPLNFYTSNFQKDSRVNFISKSEMPFTAFSRHHENFNENHEQKLTQRSSKIKLNKNPTEVDSINAHKRIVKKHAATATQLQEISPVSEISKNLFSSAGVSKIDETDNVAYSHQFTNMSVTSKIKNNELEFEELEETKIKLEHFGIV